MVFLINTWAVGLSLKRMLSIHGEKADSLYVRIVLEFVKTVTRPGRRTTKMTIVPTIDSLSLSVIGSGKRK